MADEMMKEAVFINLWPVASGENVPAGGISSSNFLAASAILRASSCVVGKY